ncbi:hypothetical protein C5S39_09435 [Candidatus Methanophagaceae archaeon]|nr:hypothetical protein C5S39_09435 [Methanophagales archaeon]
MAISCGFSDNTRLPFNLKRIQNNAKTVTVTFLFIFFFHLLFVLKIHDFIKETFTCYLNSYGIITSPKFNVRLNCTCCAHSYERLNAAIRKLFYYNRGRRVAGARGSYANSFTICFFALIRDEFTLFCYLLVRCENVCDC